MKYKTFNTLIIILLLSGGFTQTSNASWHALPLDYEHAAFVGADSSGSRLWLLGVGKYPLHGNSFVDGSFWFSRDGGEHWETIENDQWNVGNYRSMRFYPPIGPTGDTLLIQRYPSSYYPEYWTSYNSGQSWTSLNGITRSIISISPVNRTIWLIPAGYRTFHQSTDAGATWDSLAGALPFNGSFAFDPLRDSTLLRF